MNETVPVVHKNEQGFELIGDVCFATAVNISDRGITLIEHFDSHIMLIDCRQLERVDHAFLPVCLAWHREGQKQQKKIQFINLNSDIEELFYLTGLSELINIQINIKEEKNG